MNLSAWPIRLAQIATLIAFPFALNAVVSLAVPLVWAVVITTAVWFCALWIVGILDVAKRIGLGTFLIALFLGTGMVIRAIVLVALSLPRDGIRSARSAALHMIGKGNVTR